MLTSYVGSECIAAVMETDSACKWRKFSLRGPCRSAATLASMLGVRVMASSRCLVIMREIIILIISMEVEMPGKRSKIATFPLRCGSGEASASTFFLPKYVKKKNTSLEELEDREHFRCSDWVQILKIQMEAQLVYTTSKFEKRRFFEVPFLRPRPLGKIASKIREHGCEYFITKMIDWIIKKFNNKLINLLKLWAWSLFLKPIK